MSVIFVTNFWISINISEIYEYFMLKQKFFMPFFNQRKLNIISFNVFFNIVKTII